ncbi:glycosyltransferase [Halomonas lysinitropha]|uniref:GDP-mannose-dependent alpha-(1-6)-phosphatidylinositol monomannoside mannosyltransferase n=1 Tax=Halomonas lysinitropha TaxID=2607506 RepID=A0A5K1I1H7_9GAMM|nr:glycosyltransferase [Halomonas lysinitropha]VVZ95266.1 GDP-mannose-dependent alpha-(1-6)-phosphatidylinositol monomannoside mannosyltransferase [Halomonas lysinitropha]
MTVSASDATLHALQAWGASRRIAIVHDWLVVQGGAEKVLDALLQAFPAADVYTLVDFLPAGQRGRLAGHRVVTSALQHWPLARRFYRHLLPWMPHAIEQFDLSDYDLVVSSSHCVAKGVITHPGQWHVCYCHTPVRYAWDMKEAYLRDAGFSGPVAWYVRRVLGRLRQWDHFTASQVDTFIANSANVSKRIAKYYGRHATVIHPPVDLDAFTFNPEPRDDYYLAASRLVSYKRMDLIIEAFGHEGRRRLKVVGDGPERKRLEKLAAAAPNIELLGYRPDGELQRLMARARGFVFAAEEDFGIMPLEAQACGTPVIAYGRGGSLETVIDEGSEATGVFFHEQTPAALLGALERFDSLAFSPDACLAQAQRFGIARFWQRWIDCLQLGPSDEPFSCM